MLKAVFICCPSSILAGLAIAAEPAPGADATEVTPVARGTVTLRTGGDVAAHVTLSPWPQAALGMEPRELRCTATVAPDGSATGAGEAGDARRACDAILPFLPGLHLAPGTHTIQATLEPPRAGAVEVTLMAPDGARSDEPARVTLRREGYDDVLLASEEGIHRGLGLSPGRWRATVLAPGFAIAEADVDVTGGDTSTLSLVLSWDDDSVIVVIAPSETESLRRSAEAVTVVETERAQQQSADLGEVLARTQGIGVRRGGGLGSDVRFSLAGLTDDQVRFFLDGVPLRFAGFPFGIANVPGDLAQRVEVYRGVVPVRFGADALGGAVNLVSEGGDVTDGGGLSYQTGSFDTHRVATHGRWTHAPSGVRIAGSAWLDAAENDYTIDVEVPDEVGRLSPATVRRFHDGYLAGGGALELGVVDKPWADALTVRGFGAAFTRDIQHNIVMTVPYGEPTFRVATGGGLVRYRHRPIDALGIDGFVGYAWTRRAFTDVGECVYDWFGRCIRDRANAGEITTPATDQVVWDQSVTGRVRLDWRPHPAHALELSVSPSWFSRTGDDLLDDGQGRDPLTAQRDATQVVTGLEYTARAWSERVENRLFVKHYGQWVASEEPIVGGGFRDADRATHRVGVGDGLRLELARMLWIKASYEWATRLPTPEEIFGDGVLVLDNLDLVPETSHNVNLGVTLRVDEPRAGAFLVDVQGFGRFANDLIVLLGNDRTFSHFNVFGARSVGVEGTLGWTSPGDWVQLDGNATWMDFRNASDEGTFGDFAGDRIPNRPWLMANGSVRLGVSDVATTGDRLTLDWYTRYVHPFFRGWESVGLVQFKQEVASQLSHTAALTYAVDARRTRVSASIEVQNITDARLFDFFGVQRPGRAAFGKVTIGW